MTKDEDVDEMVRRRMLEEQKIMESTRRNRKLRMRKLIGDEAEGVGDRKDHIDDAKKLWSTKGTTEQEKQNQLENYGTKTIGVSALQKAKLQYQQNLDAFKEKGKSADHREAEEEDVPGLDNLKIKYDKPESKLPSFLAQKQEDHPSEPQTETDTKAGMAVGFSDDFETIESEEITMVGMEKHVTVTGISKAGRRVTRTKIILPTMVGETQHQSQGGKTPVSEPNNPLLPESFDGNYYSLEALQHQNIQNYDQVVDKNNREQYLSPEEFEEVFGMTKDEFATLPKWKRVNKKRAVHLY